MTTATTASTGSGGSLGASAIEIRVLSPRQRAFSGHTVQELTPSSTLDRVLEIAYIVAGAALVALGVLALVSFLLFAGGSSFCLAGVVAPIVLKLGLPLASVCSVLVTVSGFVLCMLGLTNRPAEEAPKEVVTQA